MSESNPIAITMTRSHGSHGPMYVFSCEGRTVEIDIDIDQDDVFEVTHDGDRIVTPPQGQRNMLRRLLADIVTHCHHGAP